MPFTLHTPCLRTTIWGSSGCNSLSSCLISSRFALCSVDSWIAATPPVLPTFFPSTQRESPRFATKRVCWKITPTRQHVPLVAIWGWVFHNSVTCAVNPSSVRRNAARMVSAVTTPCDSPDIAAQTPSPRHINQIVDSSNTESNTLSHTTQTTHSISNKKNPRRFRKRQSS